MLQPLFLTTINPLALEIVIGVSVFASFGFVIGLVSFSLFVNLFVSFYLVLFSTPRSLEQVKLAFQASFFQLLCTSNLIDLQVI